MSKDSQQAATINLVYCSDTRFLIPTAVSLQSVILHSESQDRYHVHLITDSNNEFLLSKFKSVVAGKKNFLLDIIDINKTEVAEQSFSLHDPKRITKIAYARLFLDKLLPNADKVIYLDSDIIVNHNLAELWRTDMQGKTIAAVHDYYISQMALGEEASGQRNLVGYRQYSQQVLGIKSLVNYFNSGVFILDLARVRQQKYHEQFLNVASKQYDYFHDQDVFNAVLQNDCHILDPRWNYQNSYVGHTKYHLITDPWITHFTATRKPWDYPEDDLFQSWWDVARSVPEIINLLNVPSLETAPAPENATQVQLVMCVDEQTVYNLPTVIQSILANHHSGRIEAYIATLNELSPLTKTLISHSFDNQKLKLTFINAQKFIADHQIDFTTFTINSANITPVAFLRLLLAELFPHHQRILYLDADLVAVSDVQELYNIDLQGRALAVIRDYKLSALDDDRWMRESFLADSSKSLKNYFNSGVMVCDLNVWRQKQILNNLPALQKLELAYEDQGILNCLFSDNCLHLDDTWNVQVDKLEKREYVSEQRAQQLTQNAKIIHYCGPVKPYHTSNQKDIYRYWWQYGSHSPFTFMCQPPTTTADQDFNPSADDTKQQIKDYIKKVLAKINISYRYHNYILEMTRNTYLELVAMKLAFQWYNQPTTGSLEKEEKIIVRPKGWEINKTNLENYSKYERANDPELVVSLTSYPGRFNTLVYTLESLFAQTFKANRIVLYLSKDEVNPQRLPAFLKDYLKQGLEIKWVKQNLRPYNKLIYALQDFPQACIVTVDDDIYYPETAIAALWQSYLQYPQDIQAHRVEQVKVNGRAIESYRHWEQIQFSENEDLNASYANCMTGVGGVLYPPHCFDDEVFAIEKLKVLSPTNDDLWFHVMAVKNRVKVRIIQNNVSRLVYCDYQAERKPGNHRLGDININRNNNDIQFRCLMKAYPEVMARIINTRK